MGAYGSRDCVVTSRGCYADVVDHRCGADRRRLRIAAEVVAHCRIAAVGLEFLRAAGVRVRELRIQA